MKLSFKSLLRYFALYLFSFCLIATYFIIPFHVHELGISSSNTSIKTNHSISLEDCKLCLQVRSIANSILVSKFYYLKTRIETFLFVIIFTLGSVRAEQFFSARAPPQI